MAKHHAPTDPADTQQVNPDSKRAPIIGQPVVNLGERCDRRASVSGQVTVDLGDRRESVSGQTTVGPGDRRASVIGQAFVNLGDRCDRRASVSGHAWPPGHVAFSPQMPVSGQSWSLDQVASSPVSGPAWPSSHVASSPQVPVSGQSWSLDHVASASVSGQTWSSDHVAFSPQIVDNPVSDADDPCRITRFRNNRGTNICWLNSVIRIVVHMIQNVPQEGDGLWIIDDDRRNDPKANKKESLMRYIKSQIIAAKPVSLCFEDRVVPIQGQPAKVSLKDLLIELLNYADFREEPNSQQDAFMPLHWILGNGNLGNYFRFCLFELKTQTICNVCDYSLPPNVVESNCLQVSVPEGLPERGTFSLSDLIHNATYSISHLSDRNCVREDKKGKRTCRSKTATQTTTMETAPTYLVVQVKFFLSIDRIEIKLTQTCDPVHNIEITTVDGQSHKYKLECIIRHEGISTTNGHYISYIQKNNIWVEINDANHSIVESLNSLPNQPYISVFRKQT